MGDPYNASPFAIDWIPMKALLIAVAAAATLAAGCAAPDATTGTEEARRDRGDFVTGSNVPRRNRAKPEADGVRVHSREDLERVQGAGHGDQPGMAR